MESSANTKVLLVMALILIGIKFTVMPVIEWQNDTIEKIAQHQKRVDKSERLIASTPQLLQQLASFGQDYKTQTQAYPLYGDSTIFRLETQMKFEVLLQSEDLRKLRFFWRSEVDEVAFNNLYTASFNVDVAGSVKDMALFHSKLIKEYPQFKVRNMSHTLRSNTQNDKSMGYASSTFTIIAYYWRGEQR